MSSSRRPPMAPPPERRRSQFFASFGLSAKTSKTGPFLTSSASTRRHVATSNQVERKDLQDLLDVISGDPQDRKAALSSLTTFIRDNRLSPSEVTLIYTAAAGLLDRLSDLSAEDVTELCCSLFREQTVSPPLVGPALEVVNRAASRGALKDPVGAFSTITARGRNTPSINADFLLGLCRLIDTCSNTTKEEKSRHTIDETKLGIAEESAKLLCSILLFGPTYLDQANSEVIDQISHLLRKVSPASLRKELLRAYDAFIARGQIPLQSLGTVVDTLCHLYAEESRNAAQEVVAKLEETFRWLVYTYARDELLKLLLQRLRLAENATTVERHSCCGALQLLTHIISEPVTTREAGLNLDSVLQALRSVSVDADLFLILAGSEFLVALINAPHLDTALLAEIDFDLLFTAFGVFFNRLTAEESGLRKAQKESMDKALTRLWDLNVSATRQQVIRDACLDFGVHLPEEISERLLSTYERPVDHDAVKGDLSRICNNFLSQESASLRTKQLAIDIVLDIIESTQELELEYGRECIFTLMALLASSTLPTSIEVQLVDLVVRWVTSVEDIDDGLFDSIVLRLARAASTRSSAVSPSSVAIGVKVQRSGQVIASRLCVLFMRTINKSSRRTKSLTRTFMDMLTTSSIDASTAVMLLRVFFRLRSDISNRLFLVVSPEGEGLAAHLARARLAGFDDYRRPSRSSAMSDTGAVWKYGEIQGLPENPSSSVSPYVYSQISGSVGSDQVLNMAAWLAFATSIIEKGADWEIFSYTIVHLGAQLTNQSLFAQAIPQIRELRTLLCRQLIYQTALKPPEGTDLKQGDVAVCLYHILTMLIGYHSHFSRSETEDMISAFIKGLAAWDRTTVPCIHALTLCCYELPESLQRDLVRIVTQMATIVTKSEASIHVLEFLAGLSRLTELSRTFRGDEIKTVFGVCLSYIDYVRGKRIDESHQRRQPISSLRSVDRPIETKISDDMADYVFAMAYNVITFWYLTLHRADQNKYLPWLQQRLLSTDSTGKKEQHAIVTVDIIWRLAKRIHAEVSLLTPGPVTGTSVSVLSQYSLLTIDHQEGSEEARVIGRRASGTDEWIVPFTKDSNLMDVIRSQTLPPSQNPFPDVLYPLVFESSDASSRAVSMFDRTSPVDFFKAGVVYIGEDQHDEPSILQNLRGSPDYNLMLDGLGSRLPLLGLRHNTCGLDTSPALSDGPYTIWHRSEVTALIFHVGTWMPTDPATDPACIRKKSHIGNDYVTVVFNNSGEPFRFDTLPSAFNYVYIVIAPEARSTFIETRTARRQASPPAAAPKSPGMSSNQHQHQQQQDPDRWFHDSWFRVQVRTRDDFPNIGSASETKVVSGKALGLYVRNLVLNACIFAGVWAARESGGSGPVGSWRARLDMLRSMRDRFGRPEEADWEENKGQ